MNKNIEELFKESLSNHEEAYDASAWESLSKKIDNNQTDRNQRKNSNWKTWTIVSVSVAVTGLYLFNNSNSSKNVPIKKTIEQPTLEINETLPKNVNQTTKEIKPVLDTKKSTLIIPKKQIKQQVTKSIQEKQVEQTLEIKPSNSEVKESKKYLQITSKMSYCQGETETLKNENAFPIYLIHESGKHFMIRSNDKLSIEFKETGIYFWSTENHLNTKNKMQAFEVISTEKLSFNMSQDLDYTNGLPTLNLNTSNSGSNKWSINGRTLNSGKEVEVNLFEKGRYEIKLTNSNSGCQTELSKWFNVENNYNLMSVTGIDPTHPDPKRNTFIPFALTLRNVSFRMFIISPSTGEIIFETNDVDKPWKGQNQKTDELVPENSEYIWKVIISNPLKGEKSEYKGRVTRI
jgi:hypothetical protein